MRRTGTGARVRLVSHDFTEADVARLADVLESQQLVQGARVEELESLVAQVAGCPRSAACSSGTAALHLALLAAGVGPGDAVLVPSSTFVATANVVELTGASCVFVDARQDDFTMDVEAARARLEGGGAVGAIKAVVPVHMFGMPADMDGIAGLAEEFGLFVLEDAANALGASYRGRPAGSLGTAAAFSFHPRKNVTTGEGGAVTTADGDLLDRVRILRNHGLVGEAPDMDVEVAGFNYRMPELSAALGIGQIAQLAGRLEVRRALACRYKERLGGRDGVSLQAEAEGRVSTWSSFVVVVEPTFRETVMSALRDGGVECTAAAYCLPALRYYRAKYLEPADAHPVSRAIADGGLAVPLHQNMTPADVDFVCEVLLTALEGAG